MVKILARVKTDRLFSRPLSPWSIVILSCILHRLQIRGYADDAEGNPGLWRENGTAPGIPRIGRQGSGHHTQSAAVTRDKFKTIFNTTIFYKTVKLEK
ncbi:Hypothetical protein NTJ_14118 [Nesidiocoris tenuis]|uniref:Secreted protein n=1 Tax=Nesidiocoris tenuis TaxID=355587 RepID=A0ABN7BAA4_9HEMI|nr:Hypothetical protein NTJ_14118 [Nesidiocoris tenuis]